MELSLAKKKIETPSQNGEKKIVYTTVETPDGKWGNKYSEITKPVQNGYTRVGNVKKEVFKKGDSITYVETTYNVDPKTGDLDLQHPQRIETNGRDTEVIPAAMAYEPDAKLNFDEKKVVTSATDGEKKVTYTIVETSDVKWGDKDSEVTKPVQNGITHVGNRQVIANGDGSKTITTYSVDPKTGDLDLQHPNKVTVNKVATEVIPATTTYEPDAKLNFGEKKVTAKAINGERQVTYMTVETSDTKFGKKDSKVVKDAVSGITHVGNRQVTVNSDGSKTITTYSVDPKTGDLDLQHPNKVTVNKVATEVIPATTTYEPDAKLNFGEKKVTAKAINGERQVTYMTVETSDTKFGKKDSKVVKDAVSGITHVGNRQVTVNSDGSKTITTYSVDPKTGDLDLEHPVIANVPAPLINVKPKFSSSTEPVVINDSSTPETTSADTTSSQVDASNAAESAVPSKAQPQAKLQVLPKAQQAGQQARKLPQTGIATSLLAGCMSFISALGLAIRKRK